MPRVARIHSVEYGGSPKKELLTTLADAGVMLNDYARTLFASEFFLTSAERRSGRVVECSVAAFGFAEGALFQDIIARARDEGLLPCPLELAPKLRLSYLDQAEEVDEGKGRAPRGSLTVASLPVSEDEDFPRGFYLRVIGGRPWLRGYVAPAGHLWSPDDNFAFLVARGRN